MRIFLHCYRVCSPKFSEIGSPQGSVGNFLEGEQFHAGELLRFVDPASVVIHSGASVAGQVVSDISEARKDVTESVLDGPHKDGAVKSAAAGTGSGESGGSVSCH